MRTNTVDGTVMEHAAPLVHQHTAEIHPFGHLVRLPIALSDTVCREGAQHLTLVRAK